MIAHLSKAHLDRIIDECRRNMGLELVNLNLAAIDKQGYQRIDRIPQIKLSIGAKSLPKVDSKTREHTEALRASCEIVAAAPQLLDKSWHPMRLIQAPWRPDIFRNRREVHLTDPSALARAIAFTGT
jgi:hypothetical protein